MTDTPFRERSLSSDCGAVTVTVAAGAAPRIELTAAAERMFTRDLAELITDTARAAARAAADAVAADPVPGIADAIEELAGFTQDLRERGYGAVIAERREAAAEAEDGDETAPEQSGLDSALLGPAMGGGYLKLHPEALGALESTLALLQRFQETPPGTGKGEEPGPVGLAKSESKLVTVESTNEYPVSRVVLSKRALEIGAKGLTAELNATVAAAHADLLERQEAYFSGLGLRTAPADAVERSGAFRDEANAVAAEMRSTQERITQMFKDGGHFG